MKLRDAIERIKRAGLKVTAGSLVRCGVTQKEADHYCKHGIHEDRFKEQQAKCKPIIIYGHRTK